MEEGSATIGCDAIGVCDTFTVLWFKHTTEGRIRVNGSEHGSKYQILTIEQPHTLADCRCKIGTTLTIHRFNHSDNGYYLCQIIVSDNSRLLQSSPHGYVAVGETTNERSMTCKFEHRLFTPICAEESTVSEEIRCTVESLNSAVNIVPTITIGPYSTHTFNTDPTTAVTSMITSPEIPFDREQNMVWVYGLMTAFVLVILVLVLSLVLVSIKCRTQQKTSKHNAWVYNEIFNPLYMQHQAVTAANLDWHKKKY